MHEKEHQDVGVTTTMVALVTRINESRIMMATAAAVIEIL